VPSYISKITHACATWGTRITGVPRSRHPSQYSFFQISPSCPSYPTIQSVSRSPSTDSLSTSTSPPVLPAVELCAWVCGSGIARLFCTLHIALSTSHNFPLNVDEHPHPSSHELGDFHPENKEGTFSLSFRMQVAR